MQEKKQSLIPELRFPGFEGEWEVKKIEDSFEERIEKNRSDLPLLSLGEDGLILQSESQRKDNSNSDKSKYLRVAVGDIAYNTMRMWQGRCVYCNIEGIVSPAYTVCKTKDGIDPLFHYYLFKTNQMISIFHQHSQGLVNDTLNLKYEAFSKIKYLLPSLPEQQKIAECLSSVDNLIQEETDQLQALKDHKKGLMQQLFPQEGETTPKLRFPGFEGEWEVRKLGEICNIIMGQSPSSEFYNTYGIGMPLIQGNADFNGRKSIVRNYTSQITKSCKKGDVILTVRAPVGAVGIASFDSCIGRGVCALKKAHQFLYQYLLSIEDSWEKYSAGSTFTCVNSDVLSSIPIPIPVQEAEQQKIADCLSSIDEEIEVQRQKVEALKEHKKGLMQKLFPVIN